ncbi:MAG: ATPase, T2SS/T4P/T4SS family [Hungatella sp.]
MAIGRDKIRLGNILIHQSAITDEQLALSLERQKDSGKKLGEVLVDEHMLSELQIARALETQLGIAMVDLSGIVIPDSIIQLVSAAILKKYQVIPYEFDAVNPNVLHLAMADPMDMMAMDDISIITNCQIEPYIATSKEILLAIDKYYGDAEAISVAEQYTKERATLQLELRGDEQESADVNHSPIVLLVNAMIEQAVRQRASDIHIEALEKVVRVRYRIDGTLYERIRYDVNLLSAIVARVKIIGGMDISEKRKPQDGRITMVVDRQEYDIRVSILPTVFGEKVVMRLTSKMALTKEKKDLGFRADEMHIFDRILQNPHGIILVSGPTGSGKSTTLYTALSELNKEDVNIVTVEDPVEANIDGINQIQVNIKAELTFASVLRSILRQDPDIIMIGEIRDAETAAIAVSASITGHLVVSTIHTNSATSTVTRLMDMGIDSYLIADATVGIIAQRLVRRLCPCCKKAKMADETEKKLLQQNLEADVIVYEPVGCPQCNQTGYYGRIGVYEILEITPAIKRVISCSGNADEIKDVALAGGMHTLRMSATGYVLDGITSISEMARVSFDL